MDRSDAPKSTVGCPELTALLISDLSFSNLSSNFVLGAVPTDALFVGLMDSSLGDGDVSIPISLAVVDGVDVWGDWGGGGEGSNGRGRKFALMRSNIRPVVRGGRVIFVGAKSTEKCVSRTSFPEVSVMP